MKKNLDEVSIIRPIIIVLLVVTHSFTIYNGGWDIPLYTDTIPLYSWIPKLISGFRLESVSFIDRKSGV